MRAIPDEVLAHWAQLYEGLKLRPSDFYAALENAIDRRFIPGAETTRVDWHEGGVLSPEREYLRVTGGRQVFDVCAAPFGSGFFFSWWLVAKKPRFIWLTVMVWALGSGLASWFAAGLIQNVAAQANSLLFGSLLSSVAILLAPFLWPIMALLGLWMISLLALAGTDGPEAAIEAAPLVGWFYRKVFSPTTYYRLDTMQMFRDAIHGAVTETVDSITAAKGLRALTAEERKPVFREMIHGGGGVISAMTSPPSNAGSPGESKPTLVGV